MSPRAWIIGVIVAAFSLCGTSASAQSDVWTPGPRLVVFEEFSRAT